MPELELISVSVSKQNLKRITKMEIEKCLKETDWDLVIAFATQKIEEIKSEETNREEKLKFYPQRLKNITC
jgi:hypothetical protein